MAKLASRSSVEFDIMGNINLLLPQSPDVLQNSVPSLLLAIISGSTFQTALKGLLDA